MRALVQEESADSENIGRLIHVEDDIESSSNSVTEGGLEWREFLSILTRSTSRGFRTMGGCSQCTLCALKTEERHQAYYKAGQQCISRVKQGAV